MSNYLGTTFLSNPALRDNLKVSVVMLAKANNMTPEQIDMDKLTQGYLRSPIDLTTDVSQLTFPMSTLDQQTVGAPVTPLTSLVPSPDVFVCGSLAYYLMTYVFVTGQQASPNFTNTGISNFMPVTYVSAYENNGTMVDWDMGCAMFWLGDLKIEINSIVLYKKWDLTRHYYVPQTQATPLLSGIQPGVKNQLDFGGDSFYPMEPLPVISGSRATTVTLNLPSNIPSTIAPFNAAGLGYGTTYIAKAVFHGRGIMAYNFSGLK